MIEKIISDLEATPNTNTPNTDRKDHSKKKNASDSKIHAVAREGDLDDHRAASMADEGGFSGAVMEGPVGHHLDKKLQKLRKPSRVDLLGFKIKHATQYITRRSEFLMGLGVGIFGALAIYEVAKRRD